MKEQWKCLILVLLFAVPTVAQTSVPCNGVVMGKLEIGDRTFSDGSLYDVISIPVEPGTELSAWLRPLSHTFTTPLLFIAPPSSDNAPAPMAWGGPEPGVTMNVTSPGDWRIVVNSLDALSIGDYVVETSCRPTPKNVPRDCVDQMLRCGQTVAWDITPASCRFGQQQTRGYVPIIVYPERFQPVTLEMKTVGFEPGIGIYNSSMAQIGGSARVNSRLAQAQWTPTLDDWYLITATTAEDGQAGSFEISMKCSYTGCLTPIFLTDPSPITAKRGEVVTLTAPTLSGSEPFTFQWMSLSDLTIVSTSKSFVTPPLTQDVGYSVTATNACGSFTEQIFVEVESSRKRLVRRQ